MLILITSLKGSDFSRLKLRQVPTLPVSISNDVLTSEKELMSWREQFISLYGEEGMLNLDTGEVTMNEKYVLAKDKMSEFVTSYYKNKRYTGD